MKIAEVRAQIAGIYIYSRYAPQNATIGEYEDMLGTLVSDAKSRNPKMRSDP